jgi:beta-N-acetylhexosaminidase
MSTSLDSQLGQLFILELQSARWNRRVENLLRAFQPTGAVVPVQNVRWPAFLRDLSGGASRVLKTTPVIGLARDPTEQGPLEQVLSAIGGRGRPVSHARKLGQVAKAVGNLRAVLLRNRGTNVDFAVSLDMSPSATREAGDSHRAGRDPQLFVKCAAAYVRGLREKQVVACAKHFPGMGSVLTDSRTKTMLSSKPMAALWREDLLPFRVLLPKLPLVMISRAAYKAYDFDVLRSAVWSSEVVTGLLRVKLGYKGVAVADLSDLAWTPSETDVGEAAVKALKAGCDLLIVPGNKASAGRALRAIGVALDSGKISRERLEESLHRICAMRSKLAKPWRSGSKRLLRRESREIRQCATKMRIND